MNASLILVHGAFHGPSCWEKIVPLLNKARVSYTLLDRCLPATADRRTAVSWDSEFETKLIHKTIEEKYKDRPVILVGHSKGGNCITFAGNHRQIVRIVYLAAFVPGIDVPEEINVVDPRVRQSFIDNGDGTWDCDEVLAKEVFYSDCDDVNDLSKYLRPQARPSRKGNDNNQQNQMSFAYKQKLTTYMICLKDEAINPEAQKYWAARLGGETIELPTGHSPFWSHPKLLADHLIRIAQTSDNDKS